MREKISLTLPHGLVEGEYVKPAGERHQDDLVIITNGHNGFYRYGMFPYIQERFATSGIASFSYNFSHGGVKDGEDRFSDLSAYEKNCMRLEYLDLVGVLENLGKFGVHLRRVFLLSHSLGSVPTVFAARDALRAGIPIAGAILIAPVSTLDVFPAEMINEWERTGVYMLKNNRTGQLLPQGAEFLSEIKASDSRWCMEKPVREAGIRYLLLHGSNDTDVPVEHCKAIKRWAEAGGQDVELVSIEGAGHTFNTTHPFKGPSLECDALVSAMIRWL